jgi:ADP-ribose pyrophosphatase YjhB (NUDIX family)
MNFCSNCGHSPLEQKQPVGDNRARIICPKCAIVHYQNPKIVCGCLITYEDKILLGKREIEPRKGKWNVPAGFMENGETIKEGAAREVREEVRAKVEIQQLHTVYNILHVNQMYCLFLAKLTEPLFEAGDETADVRLFGLDEIPWDDLAFHSNVFSIEKYIEDPTFKGVHYGDNRAYMNDSL